MIKEKTELDHLLICYRKLKATPLKKERRLIKKDKNRNFKQIYTKEGIKNFRKILEIRKFGKRFRRIMGEAKGRDKG